MSDTGDRGTESRTIDIRPCRMDDLNRVVALLSSVSLPVEGIADQFGDAFIVAYVSNTAAGTAGLETHGSYGLLRSVAVAPEWRGRNIGEKLVGNRIDEARRRGMSEIYLLTETAAGYFEGLGFERIRRDDAPPAIRSSREYAAVCPETAQLMVLRLRESSDEREVHTVDIKKDVRDRYAKTARGLIEREDGRETERCSCCDGGGSTAQEAMTADWYAGSDLKGVPSDAVLASLGCGNPVALADLSPGDVVLDLGSGGGIDVILSARRVGPDGKAYGLDMTDEMLEVARENQRKAAKEGIANIEFLKGDIENIPLPDNSVDVVISNCVINLSPDKPRVFSEAFRVLKPGGRFAVADIVARGRIPDAVRRDKTLWTGCIAGALEENTYRRYLRDAGFEDITLEPTRVFRLEKGCCDSTRIEVTAEEASAGTGGTFMSAFIRAVKPALF